MGKVYNKVLEFERKYSGGITWRLKRHCKVVEEYINPDEEVLYAFCAQKNEKVTEIFNTFVIVVTSKRLLLGHKRLLWGSFLYSVTPDLYNDLQVYKGLIWGKITIDTVKEKIILTNLPKSGLDEIETTISEFMMDAKQRYNDEEEGK
ncbi:MAG: PH domain-containing protein [Bacilli bacterium]|nr:PH domain-containing protein [Bacilli bacterium]